MNANEKMFALRGMKRREKEAAAKLAGADGIKLATDDPWLGTNIRDAIAAFAPADENILERTPMEALNCLFYRIARGHWKSDVASTDDRVKEQEWTPEYVEKLLGFSTNTGKTRIADAHNAALAAEREKAANFATTAMEEAASNIELKTQLAAEREKADKADCDRIAWRDERDKPLVDALERIIMARNIESARDIVNDALAKAGDYSAEATKSKEAK